MLLPKNRDYMQFISFNHALLVTDDKFFAHRLCRRARKSSVKVRVVENLAAVEKELSRFDLIVFDLDIGDAADFHKLPLNNVQVVYLSSGCKQFANEKVILKSEAPRRILRALEDVIEGGRSRHLHMLEGGKSHDAARLIAQ